MAKKKVKKQPAEKKVIGVDFSDRLGTSEEILVASSTAVCYLKNSSGGYDLATGTDDLIVTDSLEVDATKKILKCQVENGTVGKNYKISFRAYTNVTPRANILEDDIYIKMYD